MRRLPPAHRMELKLCDWRTLTDGCAAPRSSSLAAGDRTLSLGRASEPRSGLRSLWQGGRPCCSTCRQEGTGHQRGPHWFEAQRLNRLLKIYGNFFSDASRRVCTEHPATQLWACPITWIGTRGMAQARLRNRRMEGCTGVLRPRRLDHSRCDTVWLARLLEADWWLSPLPSAASFPPLVCIVHGSLRPARVPTGDLRLVAHALVDDFAGCLELAQVGDAVRNLPVRVLRVVRWCDTGAGATQLAFTLSPPPFVCGTGRSGHRRDSLHRHHLLGNGGALPPRGDDGAR